MTLTDDQFRAIMADASKRIDGDIAWREDEDHSPSSEFTMEVWTEAGWPLFVRGGYNPLIPALTYTLLLKTDGRIYALDLGKGHRNPQGPQLGETHKHKWSEQCRDKVAYEPEDITATAGDPVAAWQQFCAEARLVHNGSMGMPLPFQGEFTI